MKLFGEEAGTNPSSSFEIRKVERSYLFKNCRINIEGLSEAGSEENGYKLLDELSVKQYILRPIEAMLHDYLPSKYMPRCSEVTLRLGGYSEREGKETGGRPTRKQEKDESKQIEFEICEPQWQMDDVHLCQETMEQITAALNIVRYRDTLLKDWGLGKILKKGKGAVLNFYGPPGTGKSMTAEAIAHQLGRKVLFINYAELESKYVGETPKNIRRAFRQASDENAVLVFDEADSFLGKRLTNLSQAADYGVNVTRSTMFMEIENFTGVLVFTTNLLQNYDDAFRRRILASVYFDLPDLNGRRQIWQSHLPTSFPLDKEITLDYLASEYEGISGADIRDIIISSACMALEENKHIVNLQHLDSAYKLIRGRYNNIQREANP